MNVIVYKEEENVVVVIPSNNTDVKTLINIVPDGTKYHIMDIKKLPSNGYFRNAWELIDGKVTINIEKAKEIQRNIWRKMREPKLKELDLLYMRALEEGDKPTQKNIITQKKTLRDVTTIELPDDVDIIHDTIPDILI
jgi:hypothetical protein